MTRPLLRPFRAEDLLTFANRDGWHGQTVRLAIEKERGLVAFTAEADGQILGCAGIVSPWPGVGICWMELAEGMARHRLWMTRITRRVLEDTVRAHGLHRLEAVVLADNERNQRWIEAFGFEQEGGKARAYTADRRDVIRFQRVR